MRVDIGWSTMENPPTPPPGTERPLGRAFFILFYAPIGVMALAAAASSIGERHGALQDFGMSVSLLNLPGMLICSIICAVIAGIRRTVGFGFATFLGIQVVYIAVAFAGCAVTSQGFNVH
jgi:hypothetical protein